jgi:hypothetical protein
MLAVSPRASKKGYEWKTDLRSWKRKEVGKVATDVQCPQCGGMVRIRRHLKWKLAGIAIGSTIGCSDHAPCIASGLKFGSVSEREETDDEAEPVYGRTDHRDFEGASGREVCGRSVPQARDLGCDI